MQAYAVQRGAVWQPRFGRKWCVQQAGGRKQVASVKAGQKETGRARSRRARFARSRLFNVQTAAARVAACCQTLSRFPARKPLKYQTARNGNEGQEEIERQSYHAKREPARLPSR